MKHRQRVEATKKKTTRNRSLINRLRDPAPRARYPSALGDKFDRQRVTKPTLAVGAVGGEPLPQPCGPGLAAQNLAGQCRARPQPTMGALKALGTSAARGAKTTGSAGAGKR
jgi:hypothetical protein